MQLLSPFETNQVGGGTQLAEEDVLHSMEHYSFFCALLGGAASGIYGICTNRTVTTLVGTNLTMTSSFLNVFWIGLGISWAVGAAVGLGMAAYNAEFGGNSK